MPPPSRTDQADPAACALGWLTLSQTLVASEEGHIAFLLFRDNRKNSGQWPVVRGQRSVNTSPLTTIHWALCTANLAFLGLAKNNLPRRGGGFEKVCVEPAMSIGQFALPAVHYFHGRGQEHLE